MDPVDADLNEHEKIPCLFPDEVIQDVKSFIRHLVNLLKDDVPEEVKQERADRIMMLQQEISNQLNKEKVGQTFKTIIDRKEGDYYIGRTEYDSPEVDNEVLIPADAAELSIGSFYPITITKAEFFDLYGQIGNH